MMRLDLAVIAAECWLPPFYLSSVVRMGGCWILLWKTDSRFWYL